VVTEISSTVYIPNDPSNNRAMQRQLLTIKATLIAGSLESGIISRAFIAQDINPLFGQVNTTSLFNPLLDNIFADPTDIKYIGWAGSNNISISISQ